MYRFRHFLSIVFGVGFAERLNRRAIFSKLPAVAARLGFWERGGAWAGGGGCGRFFPFLRVLLAITYYIARLWANYAILLEAPGGPPTPHPIYRE